MKNKMECMPAMDSLIMLPISHWPSDRGWKKEEKRCSTRNLCEPQTLAKSAKTAKIERKLAMSAKQACQRTMLELMSWEPGTTTVLQTRMDIVPGFRERLDTNPLENTRWKSGLFQRQYKRQRSKIL